MRVSEQDGNILVKGITCFDPSLTLDCGQAFRWREETALSAVLPAVIF